MNYWSPKNVELLNVMNTINHQILCILLHCIYIVKWYTAHTISNYQYSFTLPSVVGVYCAFGEPSLSLFRQHLSFLFNYTCIRKKNVTLQPKHNSIYVYMSYMFRPYQAECRTVNKKKSNTKSDTLQFIILCQYNLLYVTVPMSP